MSDSGDQEVTLAEVDGLVITVTFTAFIILVCLVCTTVACAIRCFKLRQNGQEGSSIRPDIARTLSARYRDEENQDEDENGDVRARDLSQGPPPAYRNVNQYQNVDLEYTKIVKSTAMYRLPTNSEVETTSLPPDYTSQRLSISVAPQEIQASEGQLPPTYSVAQLELMARSSHAMEQDISREEASFSQANREAPELGFHFHLPSDSQA